MPTVLSHPVVALALGGLLRLRPAGGWSRGGERKGRDGRAGRSGPGEASPSTAASRPDGAINRLVATGALATVLPDADTLGRHLGVPALEMAHRGATHSLAFAAVAAAAIAWLGRRAWPDVSARRAFAFLFACIASHGLLDMATDGGPGIALLWPFADAAMFWPWRPIEVSPLTAGRFFGPRGLAVLASEALWLWLPGLAIAAAGFAWRRRASR